MPAAMSAHAGGGPAGGHRVRMLQPAPHALGQNVRMSLGHLGHLGHGFKLHGHACFGSFGSLFFV